MTEKIIKALFMLGLIVHILTLNAYAASEFEPLMRGDFVTNLEQRCLPLPGYNVSVLPGRAITFAWGQPANALVFLDQNGQQIFRLQFGTPISSVELTPEQIGLKQGETYSWKLEGVTFKTSFNIGLLPQDKAKSLSAVLAAIEAQDISQNEKIMLQAGYVQFVSDLWGGNQKNMDLYWLSYDYLKKVTTISQQDTLTFMESLNTLRIRLLKHFE